MRPHHAEEALVERLARPAAVVAVDVQRAFFAEDGMAARLGYDTAPMRAVLPGVGRLCRLARAARVPLVHVRTLGAPWLNWTRLVAPPAVLARVAAAPPGAPSLEEGSHEVAFAPEAAPAPGEPVVTKHVYDAFDGTPLDFALRRIGVETVVLAGLTTEVCVETTARSALGRGYAVVVAEDAVAGPVAEMHEASLRVLAEHVGVVATIDEIARAGRWAGDASGSG